MRTTQYPLRTKYIISCARHITYNLSPMHHLLSRMPDIIISCTRSSYGCRMVPVKKKYFIWRPPHNYMAAATKLSGSRHLISGGLYLIIWRSPLNLSGGRHINWAILRMHIYSKLSIRIVKHSCTW